MSEELMNCEITSVRTSVNDNEDSEQIKSEFMPSLDADNLEDLDEKQEEHTLLQVKRNNEVQNINKELAIKESLIHQLLKNSSQVIDPPSEYFVPSC